nr:hypothetical protein [Sphingomonas profundi]
MPGRRRARPIGSPRGARLGVSRADQDAFALRSQQCAAAAQANGFFAEQIIPYSVLGKRNVAFGKLGGLSS